jgi:hypothetical protein
MLLYFGGRHKKNAVESIRFDEYNGVGTML